MSAPSPSDLLLNALKELPPAEYLHALKHPDPLHELVCALVHDMKGDGMLPEQVIIAIRRLVDEARLPYAASYLVDRLMTVCIEQYFRES